MKFNYTIILSVAALLCSGVNAGLSESEKDTLLSLHKDARSEVHASNMESISWDSSLASAAQKYADECHGMVHSGPRENLAENSASASVSTLFHQWKNEKSDFLDSGYVSNYKDGKYNGRKIGHYSQIVWAKNTKVGCGKATCSGKAYLVCRYGKGNQIGEKVYEGGEEKKKTTTTTAKKTTTTSKVEKKTTTTTKAPVPTANAVAPPKATVTPTKGLNTNTKVLFTNSTKVPVGNNTLNGVNGATKVPVTVPLNNTLNGNVNANTKSTATSQATNTSNVIIDAGDKSESGPSTGTVVTGIAVSGTVVGAAAAFILVKKNPKKYENIKRNISRGATVVSRKFTTKKVNTQLPKTEATTTPDDFSNYRIDFTDSMKY